MPVALDSGSHIQGLFLNPLGKYLRIANADTIFSGLNSTNFKSCDFALWKNTYSIFTELLFCVCDVKMNSYDLSFLAAKKQL